MRIAVFIGVLMVTSAHGAAAQEWAEYVSTQDGFKINFPGQPKITETTWKSQMEYTLPARVYSAERGRERYSLTVVDYSGIEQQGIARAKTCPPVRLSVGIEDVEDLWADLGGALDSLSG